MTLRRGRRRTLPSGDGCTACPTGTTTGSSAIDLRPRLTPFPPRPPSLQAALRLSVDRVELRAPPAAGPAPGAGGAAAKPAPAPRYDADAKRLRDYAHFREGGAVEAKDLGPQFSYRGVFLIEYAGPLLLASAIAFRLPPVPLLLPSPHYVALDLVGALRAGAAAPEGSAAWTQFVQALGVALWLAHFAKRELETLLVHKFSRATMPLRQLGINFFYYWGATALCMPPQCSAAYTAPGRAQVLACAAAWLLAELANLAVHLQLASSRSGDGDKTRRAPGGPLFALVSCPNYTAEFVAWLAWSLMTQNAMGLLFTAGGLYQMSVWALQKHKGYLSADPEYRKLGRKAILPFLL